jgi:hypothetical protein
MLPLLLPLLLFPKPRPEVTLDEQKWQLFSPHFVTTTLTTSPGRALRMAQGMKLLASPDVCKPASRMEQIRRFIIEIIALTFNANFDELNAALY